MKMILTMLVIAAMAAACVSAEDTHIAVIGGADGPTAVYVSNDEADSADAGVIALEGNMTTGYEWKAFILGGDSVEIDEDSSVYAPDEADGNICGSGGTYYFRLKAMKNGETLIRFTYGCPWEDDIAEERLILAAVDEGCVSTVDVTDAGKITGVVTEENTEEHSITLESDSLGEIIANIPTDMSMPVVGERICIYTNGTMTMSLPGIVNVIAWEAVPGENARETAE